MRLVSLNLHCFRQHQETLIEFLPGLTGIVGSNGAGKSTLVEAIAFALYGSKAIRGKVDDVKTRRVSKNEVVAVSLLFEQGDVVYRIERTRDSAELFVGGEPKPIISGTREVSDRVAQLLGMEHDEFIATFYTEQKGLEFLSGKKGATERERFIVRMMGFDRLDEVQELLRADRRDLKSELVGWEVALGERAVFEQRIKHEELEVERAKTELAQAVSAFDQAQLFVQQQEQRLAEIGSSRSEYLRLQAELERLKFRAEQKNGAITQLELERSDLVSRLSAEDIERLTRSDSVGPCPVCGQERNNSLTRVDQSLSRLRSELALLLPELSAHESSLAQLQYSQAEYDREKTVYETSAKLRDVARLNRVELQGALNTKSALLKRTRDELDNFEHKRDQLNSARKRLGLIERGDQVLTEFRKFLNAGIRPRLAELASEYLSDLTDGRYSMVEVGPDFSPTVWDDTGPKPVISGGEEDILNLCLRLALSNMLAERSGNALSLLILDEVFGSLDESRRNNVLTLLEKLRSRFEQILVITHLDDIKDGVENVIMIDYDEERGAVVVDFDRSASLSVENY